VAVAYFKAQSWNSALYKEAVALPRAELSTSGTKIQNTAIATIYWVLNEIWLDSSVSNFEASTKPRVPKKQGIFLAI
jgi:hypothetical protein